MTACTTVHMMYVCRSGVYLIETKLLYFYLGLYQVGWSAVVVVVVVECHKQYCLFMGFLTNLLCGCLYVVVN